MGNDHNWLPEGWKVRVKVRRSGKRDKYYINLSNNLKFKSKPEVLRYLKTPEEIHQSKKPNLMDQQSDINVKNAVADNLPHGWIKEIKTKRKGGRIRKYPYYVDPISGRRFRSIQEVLRHLASTDSRKVMPPKPDDIDHVNEELGHHLKPSSAGANATKSTKRLISKRGNKNAVGNKRLRSEPDLAAGSKGTAKSNANVQEENNHTSYSQGMDILNRSQLMDRQEDHEDNTKEYKNLSESKEDKNVDQRQRLNSGTKGDGRVNKAIDLQNKPSVVTGTDQHVSKVTSNVLHDQTAQSGSRRFPMKISFTGQSTLDGATLFDPSRKKEDDSMTNVQDTPPQVNEKDITVTMQNKKKRSNSKWIQDLPRRTSKRLVRSDANFPPEVKTSKEATAESQLPCEPGINLSEKTRKTNSTEEHSTKSTRENVTSKELGALPLGDISCLEKHDGVGVVGDSANVDARYKSDEKHEKHHDSCLSNLFMDPCIEFAIKTLTGVIPLEDTNEFKDSLMSLSQPNQISGSACSSALPPGDLWSDPCFEFAVKTLVGDSPMDGSSHSQTSLGSSKRNSGTLPQFSSGRIPFPHPIIP